MPRNTLILAEAQPCRFINYVDEGTFRAYSFDSKVVVANGQTFHESPTATTIMAGAIGIRIFQNKMTPVAG